MKLADWLASLKARGITINVGEYDLALSRGFTPTDEAWLDRYHDALVTAAAGTRPDWWATVLGGGTCPLEEVPDGCAVKGCAGELAAYSPEAVPFCADHHPNWWHASAQEAAA